MNVKLVDNYFSETLKWTIIIGSLPASVYFIFIESYEWTILPLIIIVLLVISTKYSLTIDTDRKTIIDSFYILWIKVRSEKITFSTLNRIRLDKERHIYNANTRSTDRQVDFNEYIGTLEYDYGRSYELARKMEYQDIAEMMKSVADQLGISMVRTF